MCLRDGFALPKTFVRCKRSEVNRAMETKTKRGPIIVGPLLVLLDAVCSFSERGRGPLLPRDPVQ